MDELNEDRRYKLQQFQEIFNLDNISDSLAILESVGWDLEGAISACKNCTSSPVMIAANQSLSSAADCRNEILSEITCDICLEEFHSIDRIPKNLPCGHCCCEPCTRQLSSGTNQTTTTRTIKCPTCRQEHPLTDQTFTTNFKLCDILQLLNEQKRNVDNDANRNRQSTQSPPGSASLAPPSTPINDMVQNNDETVLHDSLDYQQSTIDQRYPIEDLIMDGRNYQQQQQQNPNATGYQQPYRPDFQPQLYQMQQQTSAYPPSSVYHQPDLHSSMASMHIGANNSGRHQMSSMPWNPNAPIFRPSNAPQYGNTTGYYTDMNGYGMQQHQQQPESVVYDDCQFVTGPGRDDAQGFFFDPQMDEALAAAAAQQVPLTPELSAAMMHSTNASLLQEVQVGLEQLIAEPDEFETWSGAIRDRLINKSMTNDGLQIATQLILEMALLGPHVQYNFAKLCVYLSNTVDKTNGGNIVDFRAQFLLPQLRILHTEKRWYLNSSQLQNLAYFFAEIFTHFETPQGKHFDVFAIPLFEQLKELLNPPYMESSVKTVIQVLKLTGYGLDAATNGKELMNGLFALLTDVSTGDISESLKNQIKNLQILRSEKWGRNSAPPPSSTTSTSATNGRSGSNAVDTSLYIGPDGKPLTDDEQAFLEENLGRLDSTSGCDTHSLTEDREFIDDYEKFLASQN